MRLRTWLLLSYLIVMTLPLLMAYLLFAWINSINNEQKVQEFFEVFLERKQITEVLNNPELYLVDANYTEVDRLVTDDLLITLYNDKGFILYRPESEPVISHYANRKTLYKDLYSLEQGYRAFTYKEPVYDDNSVVGIFEVNFSRSEWMESVSQRTWLVTIIFLGTFILLYFIVIWLVNKKLNIRITRLMGEMSAFAQGEAFEEKATGEDEIGELKKHFYSMRKQIDTARRAIAKEQETKAYMIATISHDLKTPLTSIKAYAEMLEGEKGLSVEKRTSYERIIIDKADFMRQMLDDLLTYTLLQSPTYHLEFVIVDGEEFFDMLVSDYDLLCEEKGIHLHVSKHVSDRYRIDPKQLIRVADNLMTNAIQHTEAESHIWLSANANGKKDLDWLFPFVKEKAQFNFKENVYLIVQNEGKGIDGEKLDHIFDPLFQVDQARSKKDAHGTGLGLSITRQILEKHGGAVFIHSEVNIGTCIICQLPKYNEGDELLNGKED